MIIRYEMPRDWIRHDRLAILDELIEAKAAMSALTQIPYQRSWADALQKLQLKREVAGTSRIEGAEFTERELDAAMNSETPEQLETRSQRQAATAVATYLWIASLPLDHPVNENLVCEIHRRLVTGCDDDHCRPGALRKRDENVTFGAPRHRGAEGGDECAAAMRRLIEAARGPFTEHDPLIQALALHYHFAAMHPFLDGNGRTARALEAFMLRRNGLRDTLFIAMSNYYHEEKTSYLAALNATRSAGHDLTPFLKFALKGVAIQCRRLFSEIRLQVAKALYRNTVADLFGRLKSPRRRVMTERQVHLLNMLLERGEMPLPELSKLSAPIYHMEHPHKALSRDLGYLLSIKAIATLGMTGNNEPRLAINLDWPTQITETEFFKKTKELPKSKIYPFLSR